MSVAHLDLGPRWRWLQAQGWTIRAKDVRPATGVTDARARVIWLRPEAYLRPSRRVRRFVLPHEIIHALHSVQDYECADICLARDLFPAAAIEAVANGALLLTDPSREMRAWVAAGVAWHYSRPGGRTRYRLADCRAPETVARIRSVLGQVD